MKDNDSFQDFLDSMAVMVIVITIGVVGAIAIDYISNGTWP